MNLGDGALPKDEIITRMCQNLDTNLYDHIFILRAMLSGCFISLRSSHMGGQLVLSHKGLLIKRDVDATCRESLELSGYIRESSDVIVLTDKVLDEYYYDPLHL